MASPPPAATSRQRLTLSLPNGGAIRRKTSITSATSSSHPLRQTSFPPQDSSPGGTDQQAIYSPSDSAESEIVSAVGSAVQHEGVTKKRKRGEKRNRGRPPKNPALRQGSQSLVNGDDGKRGSVTRDNNTANAEHDAEDDEEEDDDVGGDRVGAYEQDRYISNDRARIDLHQQMPLFQQERHDSWHRAKLKISDVRRLVNQTLSQSVPANVVTVVQAYTKMFAGIIIEEAREVQSEWLAVQSERADGRPNLAAAALKDDNSEEQEADDEIPQSEAMGLRRKVDECDRGPLLPDHLREALRRYKRSRYGGTVGFTGLSLEGRDIAAARMGGKRLFK